MPFYLCGYVVNARQWKSGKEREEKHLKTKKALGQSASRSVWPVSQLKCSRRFGHSWI